MLRDVGQCPSQGKNYKIAISGPKKCPLVPS